MWLCWHSGQNELSGSSCPEALQGLPDRDLKASPRLESMSQETLLLGRGE